MDIKITLNSDFLNLLKEKVKTEQDAEIVISVFVKCFNNSSDMIRFINYVNSLWRLK